MKTARRAAATERLIQRLLQDDGSRPAPGESCLDADTVAAMMTMQDGALTGTERAAAEHHAASCGRCQAVLAAVARIEPVPEQAMGWRRRGLPLRWLIPAGGLAAAAVALWIVVAPRDRTIRPEPSAVTAPQSAAAEAKATGQAKERRSAQAQKSAPVPVEIDAVSGRARMAPLAGSGSVGRAPSPSPSAPPVMSSSAHSAGLKPAPGVRGEVATAAVPSLAAHALAARLGLTVVSPDPAVRWRTRGAGAVERSSDGGTTWQPQTVPTAETLTAGSSPSPDVCWLVGLNGTVLVTSGRDPWRRVPFPEASNLQAVQATDRHTATVTTSDGRQFSTVDGGKTWKKLPLQETSAAPF